MVEPLAKAGQLQVVVATTGLGAGVNFSMRSVLVTDREYRVDDELGLLVRMNYYKCLVVQAEGEWTSGVM